jgi:hypothetical protein
LAAISSERMLIVLMGISHHKVDELLYGITSCCIIFNNEITDYFQKGRAGYGKRKNRKVESAEEKP